MIFSKKAILVRKANPNLRRSRELQRKHNMYPSNTLKQILEKSASINGLKAPSYDYDKEILNLKKEA